MNVSYRLKRQNIFSIWFSQIFAKVFINKGWHLFFHLLHIGLWLKFYIRYEVVPSPAVVIFILIISKKVVDRKKKIKLEVSILRNILNHCGDFIHAIRPTAGYFQVLSDWIFFSKILCGHSFCNNNSRRFIQCRRQITLDRLVCEDIQESRVNKLNVVVLPEGQHIGSRSLIAYYSAAVHWVRAHVTFDFGNIRQQCRTLTISW